MFTSMVAVIRKDLITVLRDPKEKRVARHC